MNYNSPKSNYTIEQTNSGRRTCRTNCTAVQRIATIPPRPAPIYAPRGEQRYKPRPGPRRHPLTHAAGIGHTSPQRRHQYKAPCIVTLPGAAAATNQSHPALYQSTIQSRVALFFIGAKIEAEPNGIKALRHSLSSEQVGSMSAPDLCPQLTERET